MSKMTNETEPKQRECQKLIVCMMSFSPIIIMAICFAVWRPILVPFPLKVVKMLALHISADNQRLLDNELLLLETEWKLYEMEKQFGQQRCNKNEDRSRKDVSWLTVMVSDDFVVPALVLGHSIQTFSCYKTMIALISGNVSKDTQKALQSVGWETRLVEEMDCNWMDAKVGGDRNSGLFGRPLGHRIKGTHTRFHAWNFTEFTKIIYVDADYILMTNIDELFEITEHFAAVPCSRPGVLDLCFNAGLLVIKPDLKTYQRIMKLWRETTEKDTCPNDQVLLNDFYTPGGWKAIPYAYNIRRFVFRPLKSFHYACCRPQKPWIGECRPSRKEANAFAGPIITVDDMALVFWNNLYEVLQKYDLEDWWRSTSFFRPTQEFPVVSNYTCRA